MAKLHELLAVEKTVVSAWNKLFDDTMSKLGSPSDYFVGYTKSLSMIEDTPANKALEAQADEHKVVTTNVVDTLDYAFDIFAKAEDLQYQKNATNRAAGADVMWRGEVLLQNMPVDELLGLEARLVKIRAMFEKMPTLAGSKSWVPIGQNVWQQEHPEVNTKTKKTVIAIQMAPATDKHPAQVQPVNEDVVVGTTKTIHRSGCCTTNQKAAALKTIDELMTEVKQARMRANQTEAVNGKIGAKLKAVLMEPFKEV